jgi:rare lipoprotein A (peptidoglycan hydrolase)
MKAGRNRLGRKDHPRRARKNGQRLRQRAPWTFALVVVAALTMATSPAQAETGGASTAASTAAQVGGGIAFSLMRSAGATWYGPGLYGNQTACGKVLRPGTMGVAHRDLPCGTPVKFVYRGRALVTRVIDRGPYSAGNDWDLTNAVRKALGFPGVDRIRYAVGRTFVRR